MLLTRSPLIPQPKPGSPFDLHVLSTPPAFVLSQDQTLHEILKRLGTEVPDPDEHRQTLRSADVVNMETHALMRRPKRTAATSRAGVNRLAFIVWHAVEFSRFGRTPKQAVSGRFRGNPAMLAGCFVSCNRTRRPAVRAGLGAWCNIGNLAEPDNRSKSGGSSR